MDFHICELDYGQWHYVCESKINTRTSSDSKEKGSCIWPNSSAAFTLALGVPSLSSERMILIRIRRRFTQSAGDWRGHAELLKVNTRVHARTHTHTQRWCWDAKWNVLLRTMLLVAQQDSFGVKAQVAKSDGLSYIPRTQKVGEKKLFHFTSCPWSSPLHRNPLHTPCTHMKM